MDILTEQAANERLDALLMRDKEYRKLQKKIDMRTAGYDRMDLTGEQKRIIDRMLSAYVESGAYHATVSYRLGFKDGISVMVQAVPCSQMTRRERRRKAGLCISSGYRINRSNLQERQWKLKQKIKKTQEEQKWISDNLQRN